MSTRGTISINFLGVRNSDAANLGGALRAAASVSLVMGDGVDVGKVNRIHSIGALVVPSGAGGVELDLVTLANVLDGALDAANVRGLMLIADPSNAAEITVSPGDADPWLGLLQTPASAVSLQAGDFHAFGSSAGWAVTATSKTIKFAHDGPTDNHVQIAILAATA
jgi:hypothetical protein